MYEVAEANSGSYGLLTDCFSIMDLFERAAKKDRRGQPLAERMRPRTLAEVVGQEQLLGPGTWLRRALEQKKLPSVILWGPPGTGKTTLGRIVAAEIGAHFAAVSAVMAGVKDLREAIAEAQARLAQQGQLDGAVRRRDPPLQQGPAGRAVAPRRGGDGDPGRRHHREPVLRGHLGAALAHQGAGAAAAVARRTCDASSTGRWPTRSAGWAASRWTARPRCAT